MKRTETSDVQENRTKVVGTGSRHTKRKRRKSMASRLASMRRMGGQEGRRVSRAEGKRAGLGGLCVFDLDPLLPQWRGFQETAGGSHRSAE